jgi:hypothetical protein
MTEEKTLAQKVLETSNLKQSLLSETVVSQICAAIESVREGKPNKGFLLKPIGHKVKAIDVLAWSNTKSLI